MKISLNVGWQRITWYKICNISLKCCRYNLSKHAESTFHIDNVNSVNVEIDTSQ